MNEKDYSLLSSLEEQNIYLELLLLSQDPVRGVYGFFAVDEVWNDDTDDCFYIGGSNDICRCVAKTLSQYQSGERSTALQRDIEKYLLAGYRVEVRLLKAVKEIPASYELNANELALAQLGELVKYQRMGQCTGQLFESAQKAASQNEAVMALIQHIKSFCYWEDCIVAYKNTLWSNLERVSRCGFTNARHIRQGNGVHVFEYQDGNDDDEIRLILFGRMGGLIYTDMYEPPMSRLSLEAKAYMYNSDEFMKQSDHSRTNGTVAYKALEEFLAKRGMKITDESFKDEACIYHIKKAEEK